MKDLNSFKETTFSLVNGIERMNSAERLRWTKKIPSDGPKKWWKEHRTTALSFRVRLDVTAGYTFIQIPKVMYKEHIFRAMILGAPTALYAQNP